jgi:hypothetical protein
LAAAVSVPSASFTGGTGNVSSVTLTVTLVGSGFLTVGMILLGAGVTPGTVITVAAAGNLTGTYTLSTPCTIASGTALTGGTAIYSNPIVGTLPVNRYVAVGSGFNTFAYSDNGTTWTAAGGTFMLSIARTVAYSPKLDLWIAGGQLTNVNTLAYSTDGKVWYGLGRSVVTTSVTTLLWDGTQFLVGGSDSVGILGYSTDGFNWVRTDSSNSLLYSDDSGNTWTGVPCSALMTSSAFAVTSNGSRWIAAAPSSNTFLFSETGNDWGTYNLPFQAVRWVNNKFVAVVGTLLTVQSLQRIAYSENGINWTLTNTGPNTAPQFNLVSVAYSSSLYLVVASVGPGVNYLNSRGGYLLTSSNGTTWTPSVLSEKQGGYVVWVGSPLNKFFMAADKFVFSSADGLNWTKVQLSNNGLLVAIEWSPHLSLLCAVGGSGGVNGVCVSTDGVSWTYGNLPYLLIKNLVWSEAFQVFCLTCNTSSAGTDLQQCYISKNGLAWYSTNTLYTGLNNFQDIAWSETLKKFCSVAQNIYVSKRIL